MASVGELKKALEAEQAASVEAAHTAIAAIDTLLNISVGVLSALALAIALVALIGYQAIRRFAARVAERKANEKAESHVTSQEFLQLVQDTVAQEVNKRWTSTVVVGLDSRVPSPGDRSAFAPLRGSDDDDPR